MEGRNKGIIVISSQKKLHSLLPSGMTGWDCGFVLKYVFNLVKESTAWKENTGVKGGGSPRLPRPGRIYKLLTLWLSLNPSLDGAVTAGSQATNESQNPQTKISSCYPTGAELPAYQLSVLSLPSRYS